MLCWLCSLLLFVVRSFWLSSKDTLFGCFSLFSNRVSLLLTPDISSFMLLRSFLISLRRSKNFSLSVYLLVSFCFPFSLARDLLDLFDLSVVYPSVDSHLL